MNMLTRSSTTSNSDLTYKSLRITTHHPKEYKLLSKRLMINMIRDHHDHHDHHQDHYHGGSSVSIPFMWESQPGTPKVVKFRETSLPPLTPPPSYCYSPVTKRPSQSNHNSCGTPKNKTNNLMKAFFPKKKRFSSNSSSPASLSPSSSSSTLSYSPVPVPSSPAISRRRIVASSPRVSVDSRVCGLDQDREEERGSPVSTLCFGRSGESARSRSGCSLIKVLLS